MIWYFKNDKCYEYPSNQVISNDLVDRFHHSVYENSDEMEIYYSLQYIKDNLISNLSVVFSLDELSVNYGFNNDINFEFCNKNNIRYRYEERGGGCMVLFPGNIIIQDVYRGFDFNRLKYFIHDFVEWLQMFGVDAIVNGNDVLVDGKKIIGTVAYVLPNPYKGWVYFLVSISINSDLDLINNICLKPSIKLPGALSTYGITTEEVMDWVLNWFNNHQYIEGEM